MFKLKTTARPATLSARLGLKKPLLNGKNSTAGGKLALMRGFTLLEALLMATVIAILAAVALPAYQNYTTRARITEALVVASSAKLHVLDILRAGQRRHIRGYGLGWGVKRDEGNGNGLTGIGRLGNRTGLNAKFSKSIQFIGIDPATGIIDIQLTEAAGSRDGPPRSDTVHIMIFPYLSSGDFQVGESTVPPDPTFKASTRGLPDPRRRFPGDQELFKFPDEPVLWKCLTHPGGTDNPINPINPITGIPIIDVVPITADIPTDIDYLPQRFVPPQCRS